MDQQYVEMVVSTLLKLAAQEQWEVRHASLMGIQHLLAARTVSTFVQQSFTMACFLMACLAASCYQGYRISSIADTLETA